MYRRSLLEILRNNAYVICWTTMLLTLVRDASTTSDNRQLRWFWHGAGVECSQSTLFDGWSFLLDCTRCYRSPSWQTRH